MAPDRSCAWCGRAFRVKPSRLASGRGKYCSRACAALGRRAEWQRDPTAHPRYKGDDVGHGAYDRALKRYTVLGACEVCGISPAAHRHHKDRVPAHNERTNVVFVCEPCHRLLHRKTECLRGHPLSGANLYITPRGTRQCRACNRMRQRDYMSRKLRNRPVNEPAAAVGGPGPPVA